MKAYKRQKLAMLMFLAGVGMAGGVFAADISSTHVNDMVHKPVVTKMHKETTSTTSSTTDMTTKKYVKKTHKKTHGTATSTRIMSDNHKDGEKNDDKGGALNAGEMKKGASTTTTKR